MSTSEHKPTGDIPKISHAWDISTMATATMTREAFRDLLAQLPDDPGALHAAITAHAHRQEVR